MRHKQIWRHIHKPRLVQKCLRGQTKEWTSYIASLFVTTLQNSVRHHCAMTDRVAQIFDDLQELFFDLLVP